MGIHNRCTQPDSGVREETFLEEPKCEKVKMRWEGHCSKGNSLHERTEVWKHDLLKSYVKFSLMEEGVGLE